MHRSIVAAGSGTIVALVLAACQPASPSQGAPSEAVSSPSAAASVGEEPSASAAGSATGTTTSVFDLSEGWCFNSDTEEIGDFVEVVGCETEHEYEIYSIFDHPAGQGEPYPGDEVVASFADDQCTTDFEAFVGLDYQSSELYISLLRPSEATWSDGDREVVCSLYLPDDLLVGSMEGSGR